LEWHPWPTKLSVTVAFYKLGGSITVEGYGGSTPLHFPMIIAIEIDDKTCKTILRFLKTFSVP